MQKRQQTQKGPSRKLSGSSSMIIGGVMLLVVLVVFFLSFPPLRESYAPGTSTNERINIAVIGMVVFYLFVIPFTFISIVYLGHGLSKLVRSKRIVGGLLLFVALLLMLFTLPPLSNLIQSITSKDAHWWLPLTYAFSIPLAIEAVILLVSSFIEALHRRRAERQALD